MSRIVIVGYRPKQGCDEALAELMKTHVQRLRDQGLATERQSIVMRASDGTFIEVFEWISEEAMHEAHSNPKVLEMWAEYAQVCDYVPLVDLAEAQQIFSKFVPFDC
ncbi:hypothetical protein [Maritalea porphyrae]|jgi:quinol monooxygenase YgiN|uniref:hypothetical protein n=1 Tax=Maritalea porphyrae TaxID=880732 RepID=UPI0022AE763C|nr:hypothetical protein [Maritalea porphyrae]MCZ4272700.1 hypothetical protein [Maritalea porphyrae]